MKLIFVISDQMLAASLFLPLEMWRAAEYARIAARQQGTALKIERVSADNQVGNSLGDIAMEPTASLSEVDAADIIYLPALWRNPRPVLAKSKEISNWLKRHFQNGSTLAAVGTGCCFLAEAGLLDGKSATTHWHYLDEFQRDYPRVELKRDYFITESGSIFCAASVNALADVTVYLIERFYGREIASLVERNFSHEIRRPYEKYRYFDGDDLQHVDETVIEVQLWMKRHMSELVEVPRLASFFSLSARTLTRRFKAAIGLSPLAYLQKLRIETAKELLESTNLKVSEIAYRVGYHDQGHFSKLFRREMAVLPTQYRKTVRAKIFSIA
ncbi:MAG: helix-turn-helix domain-containing protein [Woeseia sp.]|jgi:transcriptional regulator GlxA family with amidase domain|nr:helix-turn-helix domain-containing protein [Pseudomonadota bacterium]MBT6211495.1 helix-turn-helix domain-containing protein [Woeseia sp.]